MGGEAICDGVTPIDELIDKAMNDASRLGSSEVDETRVDTSQQAAQVAARAIPTGARTEAAEHLQRGKGGHEGREPSSPQRAYRYRPGHPTGFNQWEAAPGLKTEASQTSSGNASGLGFLTRLEEAERRDAASMSGSRLREAWVMV